MEFIRPIGRAACRPMLWFVLTEYGAMRCAYCALRGLKHFTREQQREARGDDMMILERQLGLNSVCRSIACISFRYRMSTVHSCHVVSATAP